MRKPKIKITLQRMDNPQLAVGNEGPRYRVAKIANAVFVEHINGTGKKTVRVGDTIDEKVANLLTGENEVVTLAPTELAA